MVSLKTSGAASDVSLLEIKPQSSPCPSLTRRVGLQVIPMPNGVLWVAEVSKQIGFPVHRVYVIRDVPQGESRGGHGHRHLQQCFICLRGSVTLHVTTSGETETVQLGDHARAAVVPPGCWRDLEDFSDDAVLIVLASDEYDESDYIRTFPEFETWEAGREPVTRVPYIDLSRHADAIGADIELAIRRVLKSGCLIGGPEVKTFEAQFAEYCGASYAVGVGNGLDALTLSLRAWGIGPGDEVIAPAHTFIATALAIEAVGATTVLVDVEPDTGLMDVSCVAWAITPRTRAIIPVHLYGHPVDMDALRMVVGERPIKILEDACQAHGARYKGRRCGDLGDAAAFSFYPTKNLGAAGDGGAVVSRDEAFAATVRQIANYGATVKYRHERLGGNSRLDPVQAAVVATKLPHLDDWNARRSVLALRYFAGLSGLRGLELPAVRSWAEPVWHVFPVLVPGRRDELLAYLGERNIGVNIHYPTPVHLQPCYQGRWKPGDYPEAERLARCSLSLPLDPFHTDAEISVVITCIQTFFAGDPR